MLKSLEKYIYPYSPLFLQNLGISIFGYFWFRHRYGGLFKENVEDIKKREFFKKEQWDKYQIIKLRKLLIHSFENVPYYSRVFKEAGFNLKDFNNFKLTDIKHLPYLEKNMLREYGKTDLLSKKNLKDNLYLVVVVQELL